MDNPFRNFDQNKDQLVMTIHKNGYHYGDVNTQKGRFVTDGQLGNNQYSNALELMFELIQHDIDFNDCFFW